MRHLELALHAYRRTGSARNAAITLRGIAVLAEDRDSVWPGPQRSSHAEQSYAEVGELGLDLDMAMGRSSRVAWSAPAPVACADDAAECYARAAELAECSGSRHEVTRAWTGLGNVAACNGDLAAAEELWTRATTLHANLGPGHGGTRPASSLAPSAGQAY